MTPYQNLETPQAYADDDAPPPRTRLWLGGAAVIVLVVAVVEFGSGLFAPDAPAAPPPPAVAVSQPLQRSLDQRLNFLGQFAATKQVEVRAQVGGTLTGVFFRDGDLVRQGQLLFEIDPVPYQIKYRQAKAALESANARLSLADRELIRARALKASDAGSIENVDQRVADRAAAQATVDGARATLNDAQFDLDRTRIHAPFAGRIGTHIVSVGNLIAGSRAASSPTTLLTTLVSVSPIWLNFDMSEADYMTFQRARVRGPLAEDVAVSLADQPRYDRQGKLDFIDNTLDRASGTIHARATLDNADALLTPGAFGRVRLAVTSPAPVLLVPDAAIISDQGDHEVYVLDKDNVATPRKVEIGDLRGGLRVIRSGLGATDKVIIDGVPSVKAGAPVKPQAGQIRFAAAQD